MFKKITYQLLIILAILILATVFLSFFYKNKSLTPTSEVSQTGVNNMAKQIIRQPALAGSFYPGQKDALQKMINDFYANVSAQESTSTPRILIVPHAGYVYSGQVASYIFKQLEGTDIKRAIILGPSHHFPAAGLYISSATAWQTPLGEVKVADLNDELAKENNFEVNDSIHQPEHAIEIELPFLQAILPNIEIVPIVVGELNSQEQTDFAQILNKSFDAQTVLVVSVDLSHYHPYQEAEKLDNQSIQDILNLDDIGVIDDEIDAPWAVASILKLAKQNGWQPKLLKYANSGDVTGDKSAVVGYSAIGFYGESNKAIERYSDKDEYSEAEKKELLQVARATIEQYLKEGTIYEPKIENPKFKEKWGVFVTLTKSGQLRGCIGYIQPIKPLLEAVRDNAISAAFDDPRFSSVTASELDKIEIEISILTVPQADTVANIIKGKLGTVLENGNLGATYLPQVWEDLTDPTEFFQSLCRKGGLPKDCYQDSQTKVYSYRAIVFGE
ncbi:MAG: AmmeMemoRadiSam system protein B [Patescibacteria group bacterium]|jgi:hypothetical protein